MCNVRGKSGSEATSVIGIVGNDNDVFSVNVYQWFIGTVWDYFLSTYVNFVSLEFDCFSLL